MHIWRSLFDGGTNIQIGLTGIVRMNTALQAHFRRAAIPAFRRASPDFCHVQSVGFAAKRFRCLAFGKGTEGAAIGANIGVVDIAIYDIGDIVTVGSLAQMNLQSYKFL